MATYDDECPINLSSLPTYSPPTYCNTSLLLLLWSFPFCHTCSNIPLLLPCEKRGGFGTFLPRMPEYFPSLLISTPPKSSSPLFFATEKILGTFFPSLLPPPPLTVAKMLLERGGGGGKGVVKSEKVRIWGRGVSAKQPVFCGRRKEGGISSYHTGTRKKERQNTFLKICVGDCRS